MGVPGLLGRGLLSWREGGGLGVTSECTPFWQPKPNRPTHPTSSVVQIENRMRTLYLAKDIVRYIHRNGGFKQMFFTISLLDWIIYERGLVCLFEYSRVLRPDWVLTSILVSANPHTELPIDRQHCRLSICRFLDKYHQKQIQNQSDDEASWLVCP